MGLHSTLAAAATDAPGAVRASDLPPISIPLTAASGGELLPLHLSTRLNTRDQGMQPALLKDGQLWMLRDSLASMGVKSQALPPMVTAAVDAQWVALSSIEQASVDFNAAQQRLALTLPFEALNWESTRIDTERRTVPLASASPGMLVNYDLYGWTNDLHRALSASTELRMFSKNSVISNTMLTRYMDNPASPESGTGPSQFSNVRLDTTFSRSFQDELLTLRIGDTLTGSLPWSRATRIGGIQLARNFGLQPFQSTAPIPALMGTSALPSDVALYINGIKQYQGQVPAGPFTLNTVPGISGSGNAQVVLTDALGRATTLQFNLYQTNQLLRQGLSDWSAELGWVRKDYGLSSFDYGSDPLASGTWRYGLNDRITLQSHAEVTPSLVNAGGGASVQIGHLGVVTAAAAGSRHEGDSGHLVRMDYQWNNQRFNVGLSGTHASDAYRDTASLYDSNRLARSGSAFAGFSHPDFGSLNIGWLYLRNFGSPAQRYTTFAWSRAVGPHSFVSVNFNHNLDDSKQSSAQFLLSWYLDGNLNLSTSVSHQNGGTQVAASAGQRAPSEGGWGWRAFAQSGDSGNGQAQVDYVGRKFEANAAVARSSGMNSGALGASGALVFMDGHAFASRRIYDSFAVVSTNGVPDVPIKRENLVIGRTDDRGVMLVPQLLAYQNNKLSIDAMNLPAQMRVPAVDQWVAPTDRSGVLVAFDLQTVRSGTVILHTTNGAPLPIGSLVSLSNGTDLPSTPAGTHTGVVGYDGATFFDSLQQHNRLTAYLADGTRCQADVEWPGTKPYEVPTLGPIICK